MASVALLVTGVVPAHAATLAPFKSLYAFPDNPTAMSGPAAVVVAPDGDILYADAGTTGDNSGGGFHRIRVLSATGELKASWGSKGSEQGRFRAPQSLALGPDNRVYVADTYNNRVQVFERNGTFVRAWGTFGVGNGQMKQPHGIAVDKNNTVYVTDYGNSRVQVFSATGNHLESWGSVATVQIPTTFDTPTGIAVDANLRVYVTDLNSKHVKQFSAGPVRTLMATWGWTTGGSPNTSRYSFPRSITLSPDGTHLIIADTGNCRIERSSFTGVSLETTGSIPLSSAVGRFDKPRGAATTADGTLIVADTTNGRIQRSSVATGWATPWKTPWSTASSMPGLLSVPEAVAADPASGVIYVADSANSRVLRYAADGTYMGVFAPAGSGIGQVTTPKGLLVLADGTVVVADTGNNRIQVFTAAGAYVRSIGVGVLNGPRAMAKSELGVLFVADTGNSRVARFDWLTGTYVAQVGAPGSGVGQLNAPQGVALVGTNVLWIADTGNNRVQKYNVGGVVASPQALSGLVGGPAGDGLNRPSAVLVEGFDVVVADANNNRLMRCDSQANWLEEFEGVDTNAGALDAPVALASAPGGRTLVLERDSCQVQVLVRDDAPPITTILGVPTSRVQSAAISFTATDSAAGVASTYFRLDDGATQTVSATLTVSTEGTHTLDYWSIDKIDIVEPSRRVTFTVDLTPPSGEFVFSLGSAVTSVTTVGLTSRVPEAAQMRVGVATQWGTWGSYTETTQVVLPSMDDTHTVRIDYRDVAGNVLATNRDIVLDRTAPVTAVSGIPASAVDSTVTIALEATDALSGVAGIRYRFAPGASWSLYSEPMRVSASGVHRIEFQAYDRAGVYEAPQLRTFAIDRTPPITTISGVPTIPVRVATLSLVATDSPAGVASTHLRLDGGATQTVSAPVTVSTEGTHTIDYWSVDRVGNVETPHRVTFAIDHTPPSGDFSFVHGSTATSDTVVTLTFVVPDAAEMRVDVAGQVGEWSPYAETTQAVLPSLDDTYTVRVDYRDIAGNVLTTTREIRLDRTGPAIMGLRSSTHPTADPVWGPISASWGVGTDVTGIAGYSAVVDTNPAGVAPLVVSSTVASATLASPVTAGTWYVHVRAVDGVGNWGPISTISGVTLADTEAPTTTASGIPAEAVNSTVTISLDATDAISGVAGISYRFAPNTTWVPYQEPIQVTVEGTHTLQYQARDRAGQLEVMQQKTFTIDLTGPTVTELRFTPGVASVLAAWASAPDVAGIAGYAFSVDQSATGDPGFVVKQTHASFDFKPVGAGWYVHVRALDRAGNWGPVTERRYDRIRASLSRPTAVRRIRTHRQVVLAVSGRVIGDTSGPEISIAPTGSVNILVERFAQGTWSQVSQTTAKLEPTGSLGDMDATYVGRAAFWPLSPRSGVQEVLRVRVTYNGNRDYLAAVSQRARVSTLR